MRHTIRAAVGAILGATLATFAGAAQGADLPSTMAPPAPPFIAPDVFQPWQVRARAVGVLPDGGGSLSTVAGGAFVSNGVKASNAVIPELDISYFFTKNIAVEAVCCLSTHKLFLDGGPLANTQVARTWLFPPTLLVQYHLTELGAFQPYAGVGVNYTHFFGESPAAGVLASITVKDSWGVAGQVGFDYMIDQHWGINVDAKKILMQPNVNAVLVGGVGLTGRANLNPWLVGVGLTYRFGGAVAPVVARY